MITVPRATAVLAPALALWLNIACATAAPAVAPIGAPVRMAAGSGSMGAAVLAEEQWSWEAFVKFWRMQAGKTSGVLGVVLLVGFGAVLLILSKSRR